MSRPYKGAASCTRRTPLSRAQPHVPVGAPQVSDGGLQALAAMRRLTHLNLRGLDRVTDRGMQHLAQLTALRRLSLRGCSQVSAAGLRCAGYLLALEELSLQECSLVCDAALRLLVQLPALRALNLTECDRVTARGLSALALPRCNPDCAALTSLNLSRCTSLDDDALQKLAPLAAHLRELRLSGCHELTDVGTAHLHALARLRRLDLKWCPKVGCRVECTVVGGCPSPPRRSGRRRRPSSGALFYLPSLCRVRSAVHLMVRAKTDRSHSVCIIWGFVPQVTAGAIAQLAQRLPSGRVVASVAPVTLTALGHSGSSRGDNAREWSDDSSWTTESSGEW